MSLPPHGRYSTRPSSLTVLRLAADRLDVAKLHVANTELEVESVLGRVYRASDMPLDIPLHKDTSDRLSHCLASTEAIDNPNAPVRWQFANVAARRSWNTDISRADVRETIIRFRNLDCQGIL